jgi:hypothetical protein
MLLRLSARSVFIVGQAIISLVFLMSCGKHMIAGLLALLLGAVVVSVQVLTVGALVPSIVSVVSYDVGSTTWLNITVYHAAPPALGSGHYTSVIQLEVNGTVQDLPQSPQSTETFSVQHSLGPTSGKYSVRARALCNLHGYSGWSNPVTVPEYSLLAVVLFMALATLTVGVAKKTLGRRASAKVCLESGLLQ